MSKTVYIFPSEISAQCYEALNLGREVCRANGIDIRERSGAVVVRPKPGTKKFKNGWAFYHGGWRADVLMVTNLQPGTMNFNIRLSHDPKDVRKGWRIDALAHEFCHTFLIRNEGIWTHDPRLWGKIFGWQQGALGG